MKSLSNEVIKNELHFEDEIIQCLLVNKLTKDTNRFFKLSKELNFVISPEIALRIGYGWREITKTFMFTTLAGLGLLAREADESDKPNINLLKTIQTSFQVISDDLANTMDVFKKVAPEGPEGIHYAWWEKDIVNELRTIVKNRKENEYLPDNTKILIKNMRKLSSDPLGCAIQLRIVEAIALEITIAFKHIFSKVELDGKKVFSKKEQFRWMNSHIMAEVEHNKSVSDKDTGTTVIADTKSKKTRMLKLTNEYAAKWNAALNDFSDHLLCDQLANKIIH